MRSTITTDSIRSSDSAPTRMRAGQWRGREERWASRGLAFCAAVGLLVSGSLIAAAAPGATVAKPGPGSTQFRIPAGYHLYQVRIPMRDGVRLNTFILAPNDAAHAYPILLQRTPYDPVWMRPDAAFLQSGYIFVTQSVRGRYGSEGTFVQMRPEDARQGSASDIDESTDTSDTIDWLTKNVPHNNGRVGLLGISYGGFYAAAGLINANPALKAVSPQAPQADWFMGDDTHHNGAFLLASTFNWIWACDRGGSRTCTFQSFPYPKGADGYHFFLAAGPLSDFDAEFFHGESPEWEIMMRHGTYDRLWRQRNILPHIRKVTPAVLMVGGWYDANNLYGALRIFHANRHNSPSTTATLVVGPWTHGEWARGSGESIDHLRFGSATSTYFLKSIELPFFASYLKGAGHPDLPVAEVFDTGSNHWRSFNAWPPSTSVKRRLYLHAHGSLGFEPPAAGAYDQYVSDPADPAPFVADKGFDMDPDYMARDQRFAANRPDGVSYESEILTSDVTIIGPVSPRLVVSTSGTDSDWVVKLIDVHPNGFQELVRGDVMRGKFRHSFTRPTPMRPNQPTHIDFTMDDVYHSFKKGDRILVRVQSSWFPLVDRNPQRFEDIYTAKAADFQRATERVFHTLAHASYIELRVLPSRRDGSR
jgi:hypothetical protein